jgi:hypothetical protein
MANRSITMAAGRVMCAQRTCHRAPEVFCIVRFLNCSQSLNDPLPDTPPGQICKFDLCFACQARIAKITDFHNRLPLHLACLNQAPFEVVFALLNAHPDGEFA